MAKGICYKTNCDSVIELNNALAGVSECIYCGAHNDNQNAVIRYRNHQRQMAASGPTPDPKMDAASSDAPVNPKTAQGDKKYPLHLLPLSAQVEVNRALEDGMKKYGLANWRETGVPAHVYVAAAKRHIEQWFDGGQERASDSGVHNLGHAMACMAIIIDAQWNEKLIDDRPSPTRDTDLLLLRSIP
jgi:hypothetical protein